MRGDLQQRGLLSGTIAPAGLLAGALAHRGRLTGDVFPRGALSGSVTPRGRLVGTCTVYKAPTSIVTGVGNSLKGTLAHVDRYVGDAVARGKYTGTVVSRGEYSGDLSHADRWFGTLEANAQPTSASVARYGELDTKVITSVGSSTINLGEPYTKILLVAWEGAFQPGVVVTPTSPALGLFDLNYTPAVGVRLTILFQTAF